MTSMLAYPGFIRGACNAAIKEGCALPNPPAGGGREKPRPPLPLREGQALPWAGAWGNPVSPPPCPREGLALTQG